MTPNDFETLLKAFGVPGLLVAAFFYLAVRTDIFKRDEPHRSDVLDELRSMRGENAVENRAIRDQLAKMESRLARFEITQEMQSKQIDRMESRNARKDREN